MRTKVLLTVAAIGAAGIAASQAQVFSVNAVGYVNKQIPVGYSMVSNPLKATSNKINDLFHGVPDGFQVYIFTPGKGYKTLTYDATIDNSFGPDGDAELLPGAGVFVRSPSATTVTFVGEVMQGNLSTTLVSGLQIVSSQVPQQGTPTALGLVGASGDQIYQFDGAAQKYVTSDFDDLIEQKFINPKTSAEPSIDVAEAIFLKKAAAGTWARNFNVNTP